MQMAELRHAKVHTKTLQEHGQLQQQTTHDLHNQLM